MKLSGSKGELRLQKKYKTEKRASAFYKNQMLDFLNPSMRDFIARMEIVFISTADSNGECDCSIRSGLPGFIQVINKKKLAYPEYKGNGVLASLGNIEENSHIGLLFVDFLKSTIGLHVNGRAKIIENKNIISDPDLSKVFKNDLKITGGRKPELWVFIEVEEAYIHCSKHIPLMEKRNKKIHWGTDDHVLKKGDFFKPRNKPSSSPKK